LDEKELMSTRIFMGGPTSEQETYVHPPMDIPLFLITSKGNADLIIKRDDFLWAGAK